MERDDGPLIPGAAFRGAPRSPRRRAPSRAAVLSVAGWVTLGLGVVHVGVTPVLYDARTSDAVWFAAGGLALALIGALDLLARDAPAGAPVCRVAAMANAAGALLFGLAVESISRWRAPQGWLFLALAVAAGVAAVSPRRRQASRPSAEP